MFWIIIILSVFVLAVIGSFVLTSQIMNFAVSKQLFDIEDERHIIIIWCLDWEE